MWFIYPTDLAFCPIKLNIHYVSNMKKDLNKNSPTLKKIQLYFLIVCGRFMYLVHSYTEQIFSPKIITRNRKLMIITNKIQFIILWYSWKIAHLMLNNNRSINANIFYHLPLSIRHNYENAFSIGNTFPVYINTIIYFLSPFV